MRLSMTKVVTFYELDKPATNFLTGCRGLDLLQYLVSSLLECIMYLTHVLVVARLELYV